MPRGAWSDRKQAVFYSIALLTGVALAAARTGRRSDVARPQPATATFGGPRSTDEPRAIQRSRARQPGRGRRATGPTEIPWRGWKDILLRTYEEIGQDRLVAVAGGVVFFSLLATFPAITALVSSYGLFFDYQTVNDHLALAAGIMPDEAFNLIRDQIARIVSKSDAKLSIGFLFGIGLALWSANAGIKAIFDALNVIYDEDEKRGFIRLNLTSLAFTFGAIAVVLLAVASVIVFPLVLASVGIRHVDPLLASAARWPILFVLIAFGIALLYRFGPSRNEAKWRWVSVGSLLAAAMWIAASFAFSFYLSRFADYDATYGSLGAVIGLMMWMWISAIVVLAGAELNAEIEHQTARDTTTGRPKPMGTRRAAMADTVGAAKA